MHKLAHILLAFFVLYATAGVGRHMHYCKGLLKQSHLLLIADEGEGCHTSTAGDLNHSCCAKSIKTSGAEKEDCCEDEVIFDKLWDEFISVANVQVPVPLIADCHVPLVLSDLMAAQTIETQNVLWRHDWQAPDPLLLFQIFRI